MAPFLGPTKNEVLDMLDSSDAKKYLPVTLGLNEPQAEIVFNNNTWILYALIKNKKKIEEHLETLTKDENYYWMPESEWDFLERDEILISETDKIEFIEKIKYMNWTFSE